MNLFSIIKRLFVKPKEITIKSSTPVEYGILATNTTPFSADFSQGYNPGRAENQKFVVADTTNNIYSGYPTASGWGKHVQLAHIVPSLDAVDFSKPYNPAMAENGKFVQLKLDDEIDFPEKKFGHHKYAVLTYIVNPDALQIEGGTLSGDLNLDGNDIFNVNNLFVEYIETSCGNSEEWCSVYNQVCALSDSWGVDTTVGGGTNYYCNTTLFVKDITACNDFAILSGNFEVTKNFIAGEGATINGNVSSNGIIYSECGDSIEWCSAYSQVCALSDGWGGASGTNNYCLTTLYVNQMSACNDFAILSGNFEVTKNFIAGEGATINGNVSSNGIIYSECGDSIEWCSAYSQVCALSDGWNNSNVPLYLQAYIPFDSSTQSVPYYLFGKSNTSNTFKNIVEINELQMSFGIPNNNQGSNTVSFFARLFKWDNSASTNILLASANENTVSPLVQANMYKISVPVNTNNLIESNDGVWFVLDGDGTANSDNTNTLSINNNAYNNLDNITISIGYNAV